MYLRCSMRCSSRPAGRALCNIQNRPGALYGTLYRLFRAARNRLYAQFRARRPQAGEAAHEARAQLFRLPRRGLFEKRRRAPNSASFSAIPRQFSGQCPSIAASNSLV